MQKIFDLTRKKAEIGKDVSRAFMPCFTFDVLACSVDAQAHPV